jgi:hypothetical protein
MKEIKRNTLELILKSFEASSKDETRPFLNGVRIGKDKDGQSLVEACDGHILSRHYVDEDFTQEIIIDKTSKASLKSFLNSNKQERVFLLDDNTEENKHLKVLTMDNREGVILPVIFKDYAKTDSVIPKYNDKTQEDYLEFSFNPKLLEKLYKSMQGNNSHPRVTFKIRKENSATSPIIVEASNSLDVNIGVLMPVRR